MKELNEVEELFVQKMLELHGEYIVDLLADSINTKDLKATEQLLESIDFSVKKRGNDYVLQISFMSYGRFIEIEYFKSKRLRRESEIRANKKKIRRAKKKDTRFYAKNVYGSLNRLLSRMSNEYSEAEIARLKDILQYRKAF